MRDLKDLTVRELMLIGTIEGVKEVCPDLSNEEVIDVLTTSIKQYKSKEVLAKTRKELNELIKYI